MITPAATDSHPIHNYCQQVKPIAVADMLSLGKGGVAPQDTAGVTPAVQGFLNSVISLTGCVALVLVVGRGRSAWGDWMRQGGEEGGSVFCLLF